MGRVAKLRTATAVACVATAGLFTALAGVLLLTVKDLQSSVQVRPTRIHVDASDIRNRALVSIAADITGEDMATHHVSVIGGHCDLDAGAEGHSRVLRAHLVGVRREGPRKAYLDVELEHGSIREAQMILEKGPVASISCLLGLELDVFHTGIRIPYTHRTGNLLANVVSDGTVASPSLRIVQQPAQVTWPSRKQQVMRATATHLVQAAFPPHFKPLADMLQDVPITVKANVRYADGGNQGAFYADATVDSEVSRKVEDTGVVFSFPLHLAGHVELPKTAAVLAGAAMGGKVQREGIRGDHFAVNVVNGAPLRRRDVLVRAASPRSALAVALGADHMVSLLNDHTIPGTQDIAEFLHLGRHHLQRRLRAKSHDETGLKLHMVLNLDDNSMLRVDVEISAGSPVTTVDFRFTLRTYSPWDEARTGVQNWESSGDAISVRILARLDDSNPLIHFNQTMDLLTEWSGGEVQGNMVEHYMSSDAITMNVDMGMDNVQERADMKVKFCMDSTQDKKEVSFDWSLYSFLNQVPSADLDWFYENKVAIRAAMPPSRRLKDMIRAHKIEIPFMNWLGQVGGVVNKTRAATRPAWKHLASSLDKVAERTRPVFQKARRLSEEQISDLSKALKEYKTEKETTSQCLEVDFQFDVDGDKGTTSNLDIFLKAKILDMAEVDAAIKGTNPSASVTKYDATVGLQTKSKIEMWKVAGAYTSKPEWGYWSMEAIRTQAGVSEDAWSAEIFEAASSTSAKESFLQKRSTVTAEMVDGYLASVLHWFLTTAGLWIQNPSVAHWKNEVNKDEKAFRGMVSSKLPSENIEGLVYLLKQSQFPLDMNYLPGIWETFENPEVMSGGVTIQIDESDANKIVVSGTGQVSSACKTSAATISAMQSSPIVPSFDGNNPMCKTCDTMEECSGSTEVQSCCATGLMGMLSMVGMEDMNQQMSETFSVEVAKPFDVYKLDTATGSLGKEGSTGMHVKLTTSMVNGEEVGKIALMSDGKQAIAMEMTTAKNSVGGGKTNVKLFTEESQTATMAMDIVTSHQDDIIQAQATVALGTDTSIGATLAIDSSEVRWGKDTGCKVTVSVLADGSNLVNAELSNDVRTSLYGDMGDKQIVKIMADKETILNSEYEQNLLNNADRFVSQYIVTPDATSNTKIHYKEKDNGAVYDIGIETGDAQGFVQRGSMIATRTQTDVYSHATSFETREDGKLLDMQGSFGKTPENGATSYSLTSTMKDGSSQTIGGFQGTLLESAGPTFDVNAQISGADSVMLTATGKAKKQEASGVETYTLTGQLNDGSQALAKIDGSFIEDASKGDLNFALVDGGSNEKLLEATGTLPKTASFYVGTIAAKLGEGTQSIGLNVSDGYLPTTKFGNSNYETFYLTADTALDNLQIEAGFHLQLEPLNKDLSEGGFKVKMSEDSKQRVDFEMIVDYPHDNQVRTGSTTGSTTGSATGSSPPPEEIIQKSEIGVAVDDPTQFSSSGMQAKLSETMGVPPEDVVVSAPEFEVKMGFEIGGEVTAAQAQAAVAKNFGVAPNLVTVRLTTAPGRRLATKTQIDATVKTTNATKAKTIQTQAASTSTVATTMVHRLKDEGVQAPTVEVTKTVTVEVKVRVEVKSKTGQAPPTPSATQLNDIAEAAGGTGATMTVQEESENVSLAFSARVSAFSMMLPIFAWFMQVN